MIYKNPYYKKIKGSFLLLVSCGHCQQEIALYQKVGRGGLIRMHIERIIKSNIDLAKRPNGIFCPNCKEQLGAKVETNNGEAYQMIRASYHTKKI